MTLKGSQQHDKPKALQLVAGSKRSATAGQHAPIRIGRVSSSIIFAVCRDRNNRRPISTASVSVSETVRNHQAMRLDQRSHCTQTGGALRDHRLQAEIPSG